MNRWIWLLAFPTLVGSSYTEYCEPVKFHYAVRDSTICIDDMVVGNYPRPVAEDMADALNEAHERGTIDHPYDGLTKEGAIELLQEKDALILLLEQKRLQ